jgi:SAM-dependent methyltransferase
MAGAMLPAMSSHGHPASSLPHVDPELPLTGERTMPGIAAENYWFRRHEIVYRWVCQRLLDTATSWRRVLDAGCGEGYGAAMLGRRTNAAVTGLDYDGAAARHARRTYAPVQVAIGNLVQLPFRDASFDAVVSLQTVEHLWNQPSFVAECARVTAPAGLLVLSTPNRLTFPPGNICHARELTGPELRSLLTTSALHPPHLVGLRHGERIAAWERRHGDLVHAQLRCPPPEWAAALTDFVASVTVDDFVIDEQPLDGALDLLATVQVR